MPGCDGGFPQPGMYWASQPGTHSPSGAEEMLLQNMPFGVMQAGLGKWRQKQVEVH